MRKIHLYVALLGAAVGLAGCRSTTFKQAGTPAHPDNAAAGSAVSEEALLTITRQDVAIEESYSAAIRGRQDIAIMPQVSGTLTELRVVEGERVKKGQVLFVVDQVPFRAQAGLAQANAALVIARNNLNYTEVKSPSDGVVGTLPFRMGALVSPGMPQPLTTVSDNAVMYVYFSMTENQWLSLVRRYGSKEEALRQIPAVGQLVVLGGTYSMRVWMQPDKMAQYGLVPSDVTAALAEQNIESATGAIGENSDEAFQYTMRYSGRLETPAEFGEIVIRSTADGEILRLKDVAEIELGIESYGYHGRLNGHEGVQCMVFQTAGSNATEVKNQIDALLADVQANAPRGVKVTQMMSTNDFLFASIKNVVVTLLEAVLLVILIVLLFLQDWARR